jgi:hypothetical protein
VTAIVRKLWPWGCGPLVGLVVGGAALDWTSTYLALERSGKAVAEKGIVGSWALEFGGYSAMIGVESGVLCALVLIAAGARALCQKGGRNDLGHTAMAVALLPYAIVVVGAAAWNLTLAFL